jgi:NTP pyrophosphatase (non-canonical NTP hydrolase)
MLNLLYLRFPGLPFAKPAPKMEILQSNANQPAAGFVERKEAMGPPPLTLAAYQQMIDDWVQRYGVRYFSELTNTAILMEEVGEVARIMARRYGDQSPKVSAAAADPAAPQVDALADELADVLFVVGCIANQTGIDLTRAVQANFEKKTRRDAARHWSNPKLQPQGPSP